MVRSQFFHCLTTELWVKTTKGLLFQIKLAPTNTAGIFAGELPFTDRFSNHMKLNAWLNYWSDKKYSRL